MNLADLLAHGGGKGVSKCSTCHVFRNSSVRHGNGGVLQVCSKLAGSLILAYRSLRVKGCRSSNSGLAGASGLQYLVSNHEQILADTVYRQFEIPLLEALDHYKLITSDRLVAYEKSLLEQSTRIKKTEGENLRVGRRRKRDLQQFRQALADLQRQVDELDSIKASYHEEVLEGEDEVGHKA